MFFGKKERKTEQLIQRHIACVGQVVSAMYDATLEYCNTCAQAFDPKAEKVLAGETEADGIRREIEQTLYDGAFMPIQRRDYAHLIQDVDKVANQCEAVAQFMLLTRPDLDEKAKEGLIEIMKTTVSCFEHIQAMTENFDRGELVMKLADKVETEEQAVDAIFARVVTELFKSDQELGNKLHCKMLLDRAAAISNRIEDASDRFCVLMTARP